MGPGAAEFASSIVDDGTPEDVAALYRWAGLTGAKYRDYSAERREQRAEMRYRAAKRQLEEALREEAGGAAGAVAGGAGVEKARQSEGAARAALRAIEEEREIGEARESARRKQGAFEEAERVLRERTTMLPREAVDAAGKRRAAVEQGESVRAAAELISEVETPPIVEEAAERALAAIRPAWLEAGADVVRGEDALMPGYSARERAEPAQRSFVTETLLDSREQVALRWPALQALAQELRTGRATSRMSRRRGPVVAVVSAAGGAGVTTLAAVVARALAKEGERVLVVETAARGLLPLYFGLRRLEPGEMRAVAPREGESGAVSILALDASAGAEKGAEAKRAQEGAVERLLMHAQGCDRVVLDVSAGAEWMVQGLAALRPMVLAPVAPEMNCVGGLPATEATFAAIADDEGRALLPFYVLNRFDAALPLHLDIREVLRRELDERLLAAAVRRSPAMGEALAEGATVLDYAADSPVARDCAEVARWLKETAPASAEAIAEFARGTL